MQEHSVLGNRRGLDAQLLEFGNHMFVDEVADRKVAQSLGEIARRSGGWNDDAADSGLSLIKTDDRRFARPGFATHRALLVNVGDGRVVAAEASQSSHIAVAAIAVTEPGAGSDVAGQKIYESSQSETAAGAEDGDDDVVEAEIVDEGDES